MAKFLIKFDGESEFDITDRINRIRYLGGTSTPVFINQYQTFDGIDGQQLTGATFGSLTFTANFFMPTNSYDDFNLIRHAIYYIFSSRKIFRIRTDEDLSKCMYVKFNNSNIDQIGSGNDDSLFTLTFDVPSGFKQSLVRSDAFNTLKNGSFGMNLSTNVPLIYTQTDLSFKIYNPSDTSIDPWINHHDLIIKVNFSGPSMTLTNTTNDTSWTFKKSMGLNDVLQINGITTYLNGASSGVLTDFGYIKLEKGWNTFTVTGATAHKTTFSFPFLFID